MRDRRHHLLTAVCVLALVLLFALPLWLDSRRAGDEERFAGTDARATEVVQESDPGYEPWFESLFTPSGGEVESGLFAMQAALGAGVFGYAVGHMRGRKKGLAESASVEHAPVPPAAPEGAPGTDVRAPSAG